MPADYGRIVLVAGAIASALLVGMIFGASQTQHQWRAQAREFNAMEFGHFDHMAQAQPSGANDPTNTISRNLETTNKKRDRYQWYDLTPAQLDALTKALKAVPQSQRVPVWVLCDVVTSCLGIAQDFDTALEDAGWKSDIERPGELVDGLHVTSPTLAKIITDATRIRVVLDSDNGALERAAINFGRKRPAK